MNTSQCEYRCFNIGFLTYGMYCIYTAIGTNLIRYYTNSPITNTIARCILRTNGLLGIGQFKTTDAGAATTIVAALDPKLSSLKGNRVHLRACYYYYY